MPRNIKLEIEYDGTDFHGWQLQPNLRTIQGEVQKALKTILKHEVIITGSGRTDVGVHALAQAANFRTDSSVDAESILKGLNRLLPGDILIRSAEEVNDEFDARYGAKSRVYRYRIFLGRTAIFRRYVWEVLYPLNPESMVTATESILGEHDFSSFCVAESSKENNVCEVMSAVWEELKNELVFTIEANRFLHTMVRSLVGTLVDVGRGYLSVSDFVGIMKANDRKKAGPTAPARGLYLVEVKY